MSTAVSGIEAVTESEWLIDVFVPGTPAPQGSKMARAIYKGRGEAKTFTGKIAQIENSKGGVEEWRADVRRGAEDAWGDQPPLGGGLVMDVRFIRKRPKSAPKRTTPVASTMPDLSKLVRSTEDALTSAGVWEDDARIVACYSSKRIAEIGERPGARIRIRRVRPGEDV